jgi:hypothetical protein
VPAATWVRLGDAQGAFSAVQELLDQGGAGVVEPLFDGRVAGVPDIPEASFPGDDVADPSGAAFAATNAQGAIAGMVGLAALLASVSTPGAGLTMTPPTPIEQTPTALRSKAS